jgi:hypothetical protein
MCEKFYNAYSYEKYSSENWFPLKTDNMLPQESSDKIRGFSLIY